ncbi:MAG: SDR family NAD(P)-dependent oxidoreductase [Bacteroidales bacterium]|jgi:NAD(P)-dependent dehydrogenase (short-subunit alcohol dehydrogenase family)/rhamnose utilization protein RhaD (predicted bifunctional aldolase and dehydrogenase)
MKTEISELLAISDFYGRNKDYVIAGGGNTSFKDERTIWIKASGSPIAAMTEDDLVALSREKLQVIALKEYSQDPLLREEEVKNDLSRAVLEPEKGKRPSVETSLHELLRYRFVVHLHPSIVNGILCSRNARSAINQMFGEKVLFVPYTDPGYTLFKKLGSEITKFRERFQSDPGIVFLENHGVFVSSDSVAEIRTTYEDIIDKIRETIKSPEDDILPYNPIMNKVLPAIRMLLSHDNPKVIRFRHNKLIAGYYRSQQEFQKISHPLTPDIIVYCRYRYLYIEQSSTPERILESFRGQLERFEKEYEFLPRVLLIKDMGLFAVEENVSAAETVLDVFEDLVKICHYASFFGGTKLLTPEQVSFIDKWEAENYRRKVTAAPSGGDKLKNKTAIVTGGAQGFGAGIVQALYGKMVNVVVADINSDTGAAFTASLNRVKASNLAVFVHTDVSDPESVKSLISATVREFGGLDIMISNAGILRAGSLDEMEPDAFAKTTATNYNGYFHCAKYASEVMKIQNREKPDNFSDIIQINSKSGLKGSNKNFAYAGAKFGGIGLTQSFALELAPDRIKVNAICPGNFYEGPLWSDPQNGLFVQYLKAGKVPGARTIEDVREFYEDQVPMKRGCRLEDVMKAIWYVIGQEYETGQAIPVTGGQVMLG